MSERPSDPASIAHEVARLILRSVREDGRITWELGGVSVKVNSSLALAGSVSRGGREYRRRTFYAVLDRDLAESPWRRAGPGRYRLEGT